MSYKAFFISAISILLALLLTIGAVTVIVDPFFHYHAPLDCLEYPIHNQRYQNDGILRNFEYDSILTGTSMTENFSVTQWDQLFDAKAVKVPLSGSYLKESAERLDRAFQSNNKIKYVMRSLDFYALDATKDAISDYDYPSYLYDDNYFNDVKYLFNKSVFFNEVISVLTFTKNGNKTTSFDDTYHWSDDFIYGKQSVLERYTRPEKEEMKSGDISDRKKILQENLEQNVIRFAVEHPDTQFYLFFPPYSIVSWDSWQRKGDLIRNIEIMRYASELLIPYENIHLFSFNDDFDMICDLNNYKDFEHYGDWINEKIFIQMKNEQSRLNEENRNAHFDSLLAFYSQYDYEGIFLP